MLALRRLPDARVGLPEVVEQVFDRLFEYFFGLLVVALRLPVHSFFPPTYQVELLLFAQVVLQQPDFERPGSQIPPGDPRHLENDLVVPGATLARRHQRRREKTRIHAVHNPLSRLQNLHLDRALDSRSVLGILGLGAEPGGPGSVLQQTGQAQAEGALLLQRGRADVALGLLDVGEIGEIVRFDRDVVVEAQVVLTVRDFVLEEPGLDKPDERLAVLRGKPPELLVLQVEVEHEPQKKKQKLFFFRVDLVVRLEHFRKAFLRNRQLAGQTQPRSAQRLETVLESQLVRVFPVAADLPLHRRQRNLRSRLGHFD